MGNPKAFIEFVLALLLSLSFSLPAYDARPLFRRAELWRAALAALAPPVVPGRLQYAAITGPLFLLLGRLASGPERAADPR